MFRRCTLLVNAIFVLLCSVHPVAAEGAPPLAPPSAEDQPAVAVAQPSAPLSTDAVALPPENPDPLVAPTPESNTWKPVVDSLRPGYWQASILPARGLAMYYNPGVFGKVVDFRLAHNHISQCAECIGYVALLRAGDLDRRVWLQRQGRIGEGPFWVVDAAAPKHIPGLLSRNWVVDIDHETAMRWRMAGPIPITVYAAESPEGEKFAAAYFSSEMTPLDERYIIPPEAYSYRRESGGETIESDFASPIGQPDPAPADSSGPSGEQRAE